MWHTLTRLKEKTRFKKIQTWNAEPKHTHKLISSMFRLKSCSSRSADSLHFPLSFSILKIFEPHVSLTGGNWEIPHLIFNFFLFFIPSLVSRQPILCTPIKRQSSPLSVLNCYIFICDSSIGSYQGHLTFNITMSIH